MDRNYNNGRLEKAIQYLATAGGEDSFDLYMTRVQAIDEHLLQQLPAQNAPFHTGLYRQLQAQVQEAQAIVVGLLDDESCLASAGDSSVDEPYKRRDSDSDSSVDELYKRMDYESGSDIHSDDVPALSSSSTDERNMSDTLASTPPPNSITKNKVQYSASADRIDQLRFADDHHGAKDDDVYEKRYSYGGPRNDPEVWYKDLPPILPIGETPYMEIWESYKINLDLSKSSRARVGKVVNPPDLEPINIYDSGSKYKLPENLSNEWSQDEDEYNKLRNLWPSIVRAFNSGDTITITDEEPVIGKGDNGYAPRLYLPLISEIHADPFTKPISPIREIQRISEGEEDDEVSAMESSEEGYRTHVLQSPRHFRLPGSNLGRFDSKREAATLRDTPVPFSPRKSILRARTTLAATPTPKTRPAPESSATAKSVTRKQGGRPANRPQDKSYRPSRRASYDADSPTTPDKAMLEAEIHDLTYTESGSRKRSRPSSKPKDPSYQPPRSLSPDVDSPSTPGKSVPEAEVDDLKDTEHTKRRRMRTHKAPADPSYRPDQSPLTPTKRKWDENLDYTGSTRKAKTSKVAKSKSPSSSVHVEFAGEDPTPATKASPSKKATPTKSAIKKPKRISAEDRELASNETFDQRGKTRSNRDFKPKRLRSRDDGNS